MRASWVLPIVMGACSFPHGATDLSGDAAQTDGRARDAMLDTRSDGATDLGAWSAPVELMELDTGAGEDDPSLTSDLLEIYFGSKRAFPYDEDIYVATRTSINAPFDPPVIAPSLNTTAEETTAKVAASGLAIYFSSNRADPFHFQLYGATRPNRSAAFSGIAMLNFSSTSANEWAPSPRADLKRLIFCKGATVTDEALWITTRSSTSAAWVAPTRVSELDDATSSECDPVEPNPLTVYFSSNKTGDANIYVARRATESDPYGAPTAVTELNTSSQDRDPWVSSDERYIVFSSNRSGVDRLYYSTR
ncbi:MAG: hypothetical protein JWO36_7318 [Myxococcales bacterium]|nr:hypothetical protein [Myxococcales bacterium]